MLLMKKYSARLLPIALCLLSLVLASCDLFGGGNANTPPKPIVKAPADKQIYTIPEVGITDLNTLDPALAHDVASINVVQMLYTGLVELDNKLQIRGQIASSWEQGSDGTSWTFHLKSNLKFSDGTPMTSADVAYSID